MSHIDSVQSPTYLLESGESGGDDAVNRVGTGQRNKGSCYLTHEANRAATVYELGVCFVEGMCKRPCCLHVGW